MRVDDPMDIFAVHALAGVVGLFMTGLFAQASVAANDGYAVIDGGWLYVLYSSAFELNLTSRDRNWIQLPKQIAWIVASLAWTFGVTYAIMFVINLIPGCHFRATEEAEIVGMDEVELGEYVADYAYHDRDLEGNCPFPPRQYYSNGSDEKARDVDPSSVRTAPEPSAEHTPEEGQAVYPGGRGEGTMFTGAGEEMMTEKRG
jgi:Amt family ammonium transporter